MSQPEIINKVYFYQWGKKAPHGSRFKGIMNAEALVGLKQYTGEEISNDGQANAKREQHYQSHYESFWQYGQKGNRETAHIFSNLGVIKTISEEERFRSLIRATFDRPGRLAWQFITSMPTHQFSEENGFTSFRDYFIVVTKAFEKWSRNQGFKPDSMVWWANVHTDTDNPHVHLVFTTSDETKIKGKLPQDALTKFKEIMLVEMDKHLQLKTGLSEKINLDLFKQKDKVKQEIVLSTKSLLKQQNQEIDKLLIELAQKLPKEGRLQISAKQKSMDEIRPLVYQMVDIIFKNPKIQQEVEQLNNLLVRLDQTQSNRLNSKVETIQKQETTKIRNQVANSILNHIKENKELYLSKTVLFEQLEKATINYNDLFSWYHTIHESKNTFNPLMRYKTISENMYDPKYQKTVFDNDLGEQKRMLMNARQEINQTLELFVRTKQPFLLSSSRHHDLIVEPKENGVIVMHDGYQKRPISKSELFKLITTEKYESLQPKDKNILVVPNFLINEEGNRTWLTIHRPHRLDIDIKNQIVVSEDRLSLIYLETNYVLAKKWTKYFNMNRQEITSIFNEKTASENPYLSARFYGSAVENGTREFVRARMAAIRSQFKTEGRHILYDELTKQKYQSQYKHKIEKQGLRNYISKTKRGNIRSTLGYLYQAQREVEEQLKRYLDQESQLD